MTMYVASAKARQWAPTPQTMKNGADARRRRAEKPLVHRASPLRQVFTRPVRCLGRQVITPQLSREHATRAGTDGSTSVNGHATASRRVCRPWPNGDMSDTCPESADTKWLICGHERRSATQD